MRLELPTSHECQVAQAIAGRLRDAGYQAMLVGGCVRSLMLGVTPKDYDLATDALPDEVESLFEKTIPVGKAFGVILVVSEGVQTEVATFRSDGNYLDHRRPTSVTFCDAREDVLRRDFTINALLLDPTTGEVIDHVGGCADMEVRVIRCVGDPQARFQEDALRLLRAVRFAARCGFEIEQETWKAILHSVPLIKEVSAERIGEELLKMMTGPRPGDALRLLDRSWLLDQILPEIAAMRGCEQPAEFHPEGDVLTHTALCLDHLPENPSASLALGVLLHDVGKPPTFERADRIRFNGHDHVGAKMAEEICKRLRYSNDLTEQVSHHVSRHMKFMHVRQMRLSTLKRFVFEEDFDELCELHRCDSQGSGGEPSESLWCLEQRQQFTKETGPTLPAPLLSGKNLISMGYEPGPIFQKILEELAIEQLEGRLHTAAEAEKWVLKKHKKTRKLPN